MSSRAETRQAGPPGPPALPSNRPFGALFTVVFCVASAWAWWIDSAWSAGWLVLAAIVGATTLASPRLLAPFNRAWMKLAEVLHRVVSPIVLGILFYGVVTPYGLVRRWLGGDPLLRRFEEDADTYWTDRKPPGPPPDSFPHQF